MAARPHPGAPDAVPYESERYKLPRSLMEAVGALRANRAFREGFGDAFIDYLLLVKQNEIDRFLGHVTDWEQREYFEVF